MSRPVEKPVVGIAMGSESDLPVMVEAANVLNEFGVVHEIRVLSAHRTPQIMAEYATLAGDRGLRVIIAGAGGAAHLPGMIAAYTELPVIGVPIRGSSFEGMDSALSILQMPPGVPVGTMAVNGARNAGLFAIQILSSAGEPELREKLLIFKEELQNKVAEMNQILDEVGPQVRAQEIQDSRR